MTPPIILIGQAGDFRKILIGRRAQNGTTATATNAAPYDMTKRQMKTSHFIMQN
ncbi:hypothetical protein RUM43_003407, partial [Polyplax serrata]